MAFLELVFRKDFAVEGAIFPLNLEGRKLFHLCFISEAENWPQQGEARVIKIFFAMEYAYKSQISQCYLYRVYDGNSLSITTGTTKRICH